MPKGFRLFLVKIGSIVIDCVQVCVLFQHEGKPHESHRDVASQDRLLNAIQFRKQASMEDNSKLFITLLHAEQDTHTNDGKGRAKCV